MSIVLMIIILRKNWVAHLGLHMMVMVMKKLVSRDRILTVQCSSKRTELMSRGRVLRVNNRMMKEVWSNRLKNVSMVRALNEFRVFRDVQHIISTVAASLACAIFVNFGIRHEVRRWIWERVYLLEWKARVLVIFMIMLCLLLLLLKHALTHAFFFIILERKVKILDLIFLVELHIVSYKRLLL